MSMPGRFGIRLPDWIENLELPARLESDEARMRLAVELSRRNVEAASGGPFGALVVAADSGEIVSLGVNRVEPENCSSAHAEIVALSLAQRRLGDWNLAGAGSFELVSSCEPCAMCLGAIPWSGVTRLVCGATKDDAEAAGFDEGERDPDWEAMLRGRGIGVRTGVVRDEAAAVLQAYARGGGTIYNP